jgi:hypothetical protein
MMQLITHSRQDCFKVCRKKAWFAYELGVRRNDEAKALRMGSAHHAGIEALGQGKSIDEAVAIAWKLYEDCPANFDIREWEMERETILRLLCGYDWRWKNDRLTYLATEQSFRLPLINPETGKPSRIFELAGKIDGIVVLEDQRLAVKESKLLGDDISPDSDLWRRLRIDLQISTYVYAARQLGYNVDTVLYDVTRKPTIKPTPVACIDELGVKIVLDKHGERVRTKNGKMWRQTASTDDGYVLQTRDMTADEWGSKLNNDIGERPDFYYSRVEVPRLDQDIREYQAELWEIQKTIRDAQVNDRWFRTVNSNTCPYCEYFGPCTNSWKQSDPLPDSFTILSNVHPELGEVHEHSDSTAETCAT